MSKYYFLSWEQKSQVASAIYEIEDQDSYELLLALEGKQRLPFNFNLKRIREVKNGIIVDENLDELDEIWLDYQPNDFLWPLMSERLKSVVEVNLTGNENIDWIDCKVRKGKEERTYYILRFNKMLDVLNMDETRFVNGTDHIIKPVFSASKIKDFTVFVKPSFENLWKIPSALYISEKLKKEIQKMKLSGLDFSNVAVK